MLSTVKVEIAFIITFLKKKAKELKFLKKISKLGK